jgi:putative flippase GtrA
MTAPSKIRYLGVSGACLLLHNALMIGLSTVGVHYAAACTLSFFAVAAAGFLLHARLTFAAAPTASGFFRYAAAMALNLPLSIVLIWLFHDLGSAPMALAAPAATLLLVLWNYLAAQWALRLPLANGEGTRP